MECDQSVSWGQGRSRRITSSWPSGAVSRGSNWNKSVRLLAKAGLGKGSGMKNGMTGWTWYLVNSSTPAKCRRGEDDNYRQYISATFVIGLSYLCLILLHTLALFIVLDLILVHTPSSIRQRSMVTFRRPADLVATCAWVSKECQDMISRVPICNGTVRVCYHFNTSVDSYFHWFSPFCSRSH